MESGTKKALIIGVIALLLVGGGTAYVLSMDTDETMDTETSQNSDSESSSDVEAGNIVELAQGNEDLSTLVTAVVAADLASTLSDETAEFTVFAPTNAAFDELPEGALDSLLEPENQDTLADVLTYHVVSGTVTSDMLSDGQVIQTVNGAELTVSIEDGNVFIVDAVGGRAQVVSPDVLASNGVVHVVDAVLLEE